MAAKISTWSDRLSLAVFTLWVSFYVLNILIILIYRMHLVPGDTQLLPNQVPICFFYATVVYLGPTFSMIFFYTSRKRSGDASIGMVSIIMLTAISLVTNLAYIAYITYPMYHERGGSVCLNSFGRFAKWISASIMPPPSLVPAR